MALISNGSTVFDNGSMSAGGSMTFIKKLTASASATLSFVDGTDGVVLDDSFKEYVFTFNNIHPASNSTFTFNGSVDSGSNYNVTKTSTFFGAYHDEGDTATTLQYRTTEDLAQGTGFQPLHWTDGHGSDDDQCGAGYLHLFNPSSTTFVKHFIGRGITYHPGDYAVDGFVAGYANTTSAVDAIRFQMSTGNIDAGDICLYGIA